jgi:putative iron-only hydrogenase system regulator
LERLFCARRKQARAFFEGGIMDTRIALVGIIVENPDSVDALNDILHEYAGHIIGRMGVPYRSRGISIISVIIDAGNDVISALSGKIGRLPGINAKTLYSGRPAAQGGGGQA